MNILITAGGTLGHIMPGLILAKELSKKHSVIYIASLKDEKYDVIKKADYIKKVYYIDSQGFNKNILYNLKTIKKVFNATKNIKQILKQENINLAIGMGGYISGIVINVCNKEKIKTIIHEQNQVMGLANRLVLKRSNKILLSFNNKIPNKYKAKTYQVGNPRMFIERPTNLKKKNDQILITSGSNGASFINNLAEKLCNSNLLIDYKIILITGKKYYEEVKQKIKKSNVKIIDFVDNIIPYLYESSMVITRAGSSTIFESIAMSTIPIMIPSINVTGNHQYYNAKEIKNLGMGEVVEENEDSYKKILKTIDKVNYNKDKYISNMTKYKTKYTLKRLIDIIERND